jgi:hypothetical protein
VQIELGERGGKGKRVCEVCCRVGALSMRRALPCPPIVADRGTSPAILQPTGAAGALAAAHPAEEGKKLEFRFGLSSKLSSASSLGPGTRPFLAANITCAVAHCLPTYLFNNNYHVELLTKAPWRRILLPSFCQADLMQSSHGSSRRPLVLFNSTPHNLPTFVLMSPLRAV